MMNPNCIRGIGNDIIEIARLRKAMQRHGEALLHRLFTSEEQDYCFLYKDPVIHFAGRFAAKEAIAKALGTGFGSQLSWRDIQITNQRSGKPIALFSEPLLRRLGPIQVLLSISHCKAYATAIAIWIDEISST